MSFLHILRYCIICFYYIRKNSTYESVTDLLLYLQPVSTMVTPISDQNQLTLVEPQHLAYSLMEEN